MSLNLLATQVQSYDAFPRYVDSDKRLNAGLEQVLNLSSYRKS